MNTIILWATILTAPFNVEVKEKYGPSIDIDSVNVVVIKDNNIYVNRNGDLYGVYPLSNYSIRKK